MDLQGRRIIVYRTPREGEYSEMTTATDGALAPLAFPDLALPVETLLGPPPKNDAGE